MILTIVKKKVKFNLPSSDSEETDDHSDDDPYNYRQESSSESDIEDSDENVGSASDEHDTSDGSDANEDSWDGQQETVSHSDEEDSDEDIGLASDENDNDDDDSTVGDYQSEEDDDVGTLEETLKNETKHQTTTKMDNNAKKAKTDEYWEDIYGRLRDRQGNVIERKTNSSGCYVPPALRKVENNDDPKKAEVFQKLKRQLKGLLNRYATCYHYHHLTLMIFASSEHIWPLALRMMSEVIYRVLATGGLTIT